MKRWVLKIGREIVTIENDCETLDEMRSSILHNCSLNYGFMKVDNRLVNVKAIEQICEERHYINGTVKF